MSVSGDNTPKKTDHREASVDDLFVEYDSHRVDQDFKQMDFKSEKIHRSDTSSFFTRISDYRRKKKLEARKEAAYRKKQNLRRRKFRRLIYEDIKSSEDAKRRHERNRWLKQHRLRIVVAVLVLLGLLAIGAFVLYQSLHKSSAEIHYEELGEIEQHAAENYDIFEVEMLPLAEHAGQEGLDEACRRGDEILRGMADDSAYIDFSTRYALFVYENWSELEGAPIRSLEIMSRAYLHVHNEEQQYVLNNSYLYLYRLMGNQEKIEEYQTKVDEYNQKYESGMGGAVAN